MIAPRIASFAIATGCLILMLALPGCDPLGDFNLSGPLDPPGEGGGGNKRDLIEVGRNLFFNETFDGNGRTCGTCHRAENNMTIDVGFIADLFNNDPLDPLFVAELNSDLTNLEDGGPTGLLRMNGLILANIQGFAADPVFRAPPSLFNLSFTAPYGLSGDFSNLRDFAVGAVRQHFPKTLFRIEGQDFRLPTEPELDALEAFMLSLESPADGKFKLSGPRSILSTPVDPKAQDTSRPEVRGRDLFLSKGCTSCHVGTVFSGGNRNTDVEQLISFGLVGDNGDGSGRFQTPGLFGLRKRAFFHNNAVVGLRNAVAFYVSTAFKDSPTGGQVADMSETEIDDITAFLEAIK